MYLQPTGFCRVTPHFRPSLYTLITSIVIQNFEDLVSPPERTAYTRCYFKRLVYPYGVYKCTFLRLVCLHIGNLPHGTGKKEQ